MKGFRFTIPVCTGMTDLKTNCHAEERSIFIWGIQERFLPAVGKLRCAQNDRSFWVFLVSSPPLVPISFGLNQKKQKFKAGLFS